MLALIHRSLVSLNRKNSGRKWTRIVCICWLGFDLVVSGFFTGLGTVNAQTVPTPSEIASKSEEALEIQYFSVGCFKIKYGESAILTDPFWSHLPLKTVLFGKIHPDSTQIDPYLPRLDDIDGVLVCHAHYDHILDLPYISHKLPPAAPVIGSKTMRHTIAPFHLPHPVIEVNETMAGPDRPGKWIELDEGNIRVLPIKAGHPDHVWFVHLWNKELTQDLTEKPTKGKHWQEGVTLGFLMDFMDPKSGSIKYRVFFQSSSTPYPSGFIPQSILNEHPVNAALLGMDFINMQLQGERNVMPYLKPETVIFCHWEDFFKPKTQPPKEQLLKKLRNQIESLEADNPHGTRYLVPSWSGKYYFYR